MTAQFAPAQAAEWGRARVALLCEPGLETLFDILQPHAANFLRPFALEQGQRQHRAFRRCLTEQGVQVIDLRQALAHGADSDAEARGRLESWARASVRLETEDLPAAEAARSADMLRHAIRALDAAALVELILLRPILRVSLNPAGLDPTTRLLARYEVSGRSAYYLRDPLITTAAGCVIGRLRLEQRRAENDVAEYALRQLGIRPLYRVQAPGLLEGGDFLPAGDFVLQGQGLLTNAEGIRQCLEQGVYGQVEVAVVKDPLAGMEEMHLDTYFALLGPRLCALAAERMAPPAEPEVDVYQPHAASGRYRLARTLPFTHYLAEKGLAILPFARAEQQDFAPNGLLLDAQRWLGVRQGGDDFARRLGQQGLTVTLLDYDALTGGYGGLHCSSQILLRDLPA